MENNSFSLKEWSFCIIIVVYVFAGKSIVLIFPNMKKWLKSEKQFLFKILRFIG